MYMTALNKKLTDANVTNNREAQNHKSSEQITFDLSVIKEAHSSEQSRW